VGCLPESFLAIVALLFPDLQAFNLVDDIGRRHGHFDGCFCQDSAARNFLYNDLHAYCGVRVLRERI